MSTYLRQLNCQQVKGDSKQRNVWHTQHLRVILKLLDKNIRFIGQKGQEAIIIQRSITHIYMDQHGICIGSVKVIRDSTSITRTIGRCRAKEWWGQNLHISDHILIQIKDKGPRARDTTTIELMVEGKMNKVTLAIVNNVIQNEVRISWHMMNSYGLLKKI